MRDQTPPENTYAVSCYCANCGNGQILHIPKGKRAPRPQGLIRFGSESDTPPQYCERCGCNDVVAHNF